MADCTRREVTQIWIEYTLPTPTNWGELRKLIAIVQSELGDAAAWDTAAEVLATDEGVIIRWEKQAGHG